MTRVQTPEKKPALAPRTARRVTLIGMTDSIARFGTPGPQADMGPAITGHAVSGSHARLAQAQRTPRGLIPPMLFGHEFHDRGVGAVRGNGVAVGAFVFAASFPRCLQLSTAP